MRAIIFAAVVALGGVANAWPPSWVPGYGGYVPADGTVLVLPLIDWTTDPPQLVRDAHGHPVLGWRPSLEIYAGMGTPIVPGHWVPSPMPADIDTLIGGAQGGKMYDQNWQPFVPPVYQWAPLP